MADAYCSANAMLHGVSVFSPNGFLLAEPADI
jgi:hypothetical protein